MAVNTRFKIKPKIAGLRQANPYLQEEVLRGVKHIGDRLQEKIRAKQRKDTGEERRRTEYKVITRKRGVSMTLRVYNTSIQGAVDETGAKPHFPPYKQGSKLFKWVQRKGLATLRDNKEKSGRASTIRRKARAAGATKAEAAAVSAFSRKRDNQINVNRIQSIAFAIAKSISRRGLPRPGDPLRKPFETAGKESVNMVNTILNFAVLKAVKRVNDEGKADS